MNEKASVFYLISFFKSNSRFIFISGLIGLFVGIIFAVFTPAEYKSEVGFISEKKTAAFPALSGLPGLSGLDLGAPSDNINSELYINIIQSPQFIREMKQKHFQSEEYGELQLMDYSLNYEKNSLARSIISFPSTVRSYFRRMGEEELLVEPQTDSLRSGAVYIERLSDEERVLMKYVSENVEIRMDKGTGLINLLVFHQDRHISAELANYIFENLKDALREMQVEKAKRKYEFVDLQYEQSLRKFNDI